MVKMQDLQDLLETVLWTGYLKDEDPVSLFIIAKPESGKTASIARYISNKGINYFTEITAWGITEAILPALSRGEDIHHIIIPDFLNCVVKNRSTAEKLIMFLNSLTEEGISNIATYANRGIPKKVSVETKESFIKCGVITCITKSEYDKRKKRWQSLGFLSRFLPIQYEYSSGFVDNVLNNITENQKKLSEDIHLNFPSEKQTIILPKEISEKFIPYSKIIASNIDAYGIRLLIIFNSLLKANALKNNRNIVSEDDFKIILKFVDFIKYNTNKVTTIDN